MIFNLVLDCTIIQSEGTELFFLIECNFDLQEMIMKIIFFSCVQLVFP